VTRVAAAHPYRDFEFAGWEQAAEAYSDTFELATQLYCDALLDAVEVQPGETLLDDACGTGLLAGEALKRGVDVVGADFSPAMLARAASLHPTIRFEQADAEALPFSAKSFDAVVVNFGLHHFPFPVQALAEVRRVLRPGGRAACTVWSTPDRHALHAIALAAVRSAGDAGASLPTPPHGGLNTVAQCLKLMGDAGLIPDEKRSGLVERVLRLPSATALAHLIESGTVRMASLLRSQSAMNRTLVLRALEDAAAECSGPAGLHIPVVAVVVVAKRE
jgi:ubiquinone/menaquinone biosynthesis C-methylase UbiE